MGLPSSGEIQRKSPERKSNLNEKILRTGLRPEGLEYWLLENKNEVF